MLRVQKISQAQAWQRTGRAGRQSAGACYRVYTRAEFDAMSRDTVPEIQRCSLASVALQLLTIGVRDVRNFDFLDRPDAEVRRTWRARTEQTGRRAAVVEQGEGRLPVLRGMIYVVWSYCGGILCNIWHAMISSFFN